MSLVFEVPFEGVVAGAAVLAQEPAFRRLLAVRQPPYHFVLAVCFPPGAPLPRQGRRGAKGHV